MHSFFSLFFKQMEMDGEYSTPVPRTLERVESQWWKLTSISRIRGITSLAERFVVAQCHAFRSKCLSEQLDHSARSQRARAVCVCVCVCGVSVGSDVLIIDFNRLFYFKKKLRLHNYWHANRSRRATSFTWLDITHKTDIQNVSFLRGKINMINLGPDCSRVSLAFSKRASSD